jgi:hypothetical protein
MRDISARPAGAVELAGKKVYLAKHTNRSRPAEPGVGP